MKLKNIDEICSFPVKFFKVLQNSQEYTYARVSLLIKLQAEWL